jgi:transcription initiation factor TFIID subunit 7
LKKLTVDLELKKAQRDEIREKQRLKKEGIEAVGGDSDGDQLGADGDGPEEDDLFGPDDGDLSMEIG